MKDDRQICIAYVDYENLVEALSRHNSLDMVTLLNDVLERARQQFRIQRILLFGHWTLYALPPQIDMRGVVRRACQDPGADVGLQIERSILQGLDGKESGDIYLLISGEARYGRVCTQLDLAHKRSVLWTLAPLSQQEHSWQDRHTIIPLPPALVRQKLPRSLLLQALVLETATSCLHRPGLLTLPELRDALEQQAALPAEVDSLILLGLRERILFVQDAADPLQDPQVSLNRRHELTRRALLLQDRILNTVRVLQEPRGWVAFSTLEKALATYSCFADDQPFRQHWIDLLLSLGRLLKTARPRPGVSLPTTTLCLNPADPQATSEQLGRQNLTTLICVTQSFLLRRRKSWLSTTHLHRRLTAHMTYAEARATLKQAQAEQVLRSVTRPAQRDPERSVTLVQENRQHPLVQETLALRDRLLLAGYALLGERDLRSWESLLLAEFCAAGRCSEDEACYWLRLLTREGLLQTRPLESQGQPGEHLVSFALDDPLVRQLLADAREQRAQREATER